MATPAHLKHPVEDQRWALVHRILASPGFARAPRLCEFLHYICECALSGREDEISEHQIGVHVFKRAANYNPNDDSIVRSHARLLRHKLELYFEQQGQSEELRIVIPKGRYVPLFEHREALDTGAAETGSEPGLASRRSPSTWWIGLSVALLAGALGASAVLRWSGSAGASHSLGQAFWKSFFSSGKKVLIVPADSALALLEDLTHERVQLSDYLNRKYSFGLSGHAGWSESVLSSIASRQYTSMADLNLAVRLVRLGTASSGQIEIRYARNLQLHDLKEGSAVLIGGPRANPWEELFEKKMNFYLDSNLETAENAVCNRVPRTGEKVRYSDVQGASALRAYGLLAFLPGLTPATRVLIVEGTSSVGTECAADFLLDDVSLSAFLAHIPGAGKKLPFFEVLLETAIVGGNAQQPQITAYRLVDN